MPPRIAFIVPRYGEDIVGGAETLARGLAEQAQAAGLAQVEVFTSCARDHFTWRNELPAGAAMTNGVLVRRFPMVHAPADVDRWHALHERLIFRQDLSIEEQYEWVHRAAHSPELYRHLVRHGREFDSLIFIPYLFGTTYYGSTIYPERSIVCPCLHDEFYAYLDPTRNLFHAARGLMFNSEPEAQLARRLYGPHPGAHVVGLGLEPFMADAARFRRRFGVREPFVLYAGRLESPKNVPLLVHHFVTYKENRPGPLKLVLIGQGELQLPRHPDIIPLGFQPEQTKRDAYAAAAVLCQPSVKESFSIVMMEAWLAGTPALVHADCDVTRYNVARSDGGLYFQNYAEFEGAVDILVGDETVRQLLAVNGRAYVQRQHSWEVVLRRFEYALKQWAPPMREFLPTPDEERAA